MKHSAYPKYKDSGVEWMGMVPEHWAVKRGRFVMQVNPSAPRLRALKPEDEVSFVTMDAVGEYGGIRLDQTRQIDEVGSGYTEFQDGDVVVAKITPCFENGKGALAQGLRNGVAYGTTELHVLRTLPTLERRYLFYLTISSLYREAGEAEMYGAGGQKRVPPEFNKDFRTPLPRLDEQRTIADFLDVQTAKIDTLLAKKRELIERLKEKRTTLISRTVTRGLPPEAARAAGLDPNPSMKDSGVAWLGDVPQGWELLKFSREVRIAEGQVDPEKEPYASMVLIGPEHVESGTGRLLFRASAADQAAESGKYFCSKGDVIYSKIRPALKKVVIAEDNCLCSADMYPLNGRQRLDNRYIYWLLLSSEFSAWAVLESDRVAMPKINRDTLNSLIMPVPTLHEQVSIANFLDHESTKIDRMISKTEEAVERLQEYRISLVTATVTGKIDVREVVA